MYVGLRFPRSRSATMTAVWPRGLPAASTTYHLRTMLPLFAIKVDMVDLSILCSFDSEDIGKFDSYSFAIEGSLYFGSKSGTILCEQIYL